MQLAGFFISVLIICFSGNAKRQQEQTQVDTAFLRTAAQYNQAIIAASKIASTRTHNDAIAKLADLLIIDHGNAVTQLDSIVRKLGISGVVTDLNDNDQERLKALQSVPDKQINAVYIGWLTDTYNHLVVSFSEQVTLGGHQLLKEYAQIKLPMLLEHQKTAELAGGRFKKLSK